MYSESESSTESKEKNETDEEMWLAIEQEKEKSVKYVTEALLKRRYQLVKILGKGTFGDILMMERPDGQTFAVKIVTKKLLSPGEIYYWPGLQNQNVQALREVLLFPEIKACAFLMDVQKKSLSDILEDEREINLDFMARIKKWMKQILMGLDYIHGKGLSHNDMKTDNVLITFDDQAVITDFGFVERRSSLAIRYGVPLHYRPPEAFPIAVGTNTPVEGVALDLWATGMLAAECLTRHGVCLALENIEKSWSDKMYPVMFEFFQVKHLLKVMKRAFPRLKMDTSTVQDVRSFVLQFLQMNPACRPSARQALEHQFLENGSGIGSEDSIWKNKVEERVIQSFVHGYQEAIKLQKVEASQSYFLDETRPTITTISSVSEENYAGHETNNNILSSYSKTSNVDMSLDNYEDPLPDQWNESEHYSDDEDAWKIPSSYNYAAIEDVPYPEEEVPGNVPATENCIAKGPAPCFATHHEGGQCVRQLLERTNLHRVDHFRKNSSAVQYYSDPGVGIAASTKSLLWQNTRHASLYEIHKETLKCKRNASDQKVSSRSTLGVINEKIPLVRSEEIVFSNIRSVRQDLLCTKLTGPDSPLHEASGYVIETSTNRLRSESISLELTQSIQANQNLPNILESECKHEVVPLDIAKQTAEERIEEIDPNDLEIPKVTEKDTENRGCSGVRRIFRWIRKRTRRDARIFVCGGKPAAN